MQSPALDPYRLSIFLQQDDNKKCKSTDASLCPEANFRTHWLCPIDLEVTDDKTASSCNVLVKLHGNFNEGANLLRAKLIQADTSPDASG